MQLTAKLTPHQEWLLINAVSILMDTPVSNKARAALEEAIRHIKAALGPENCKEPTTEELLDYVALLVDKLNSRRTKNLYYLTIETDDNE